MKARLGALWETLHSSFWFVPSLMTAGAMALAWGVLTWDRSAGETTASYLYGGGVEGARSMLSAIASSVLGIAGVTFSITIAALSLASSQFGPRLLRSFIRDRGNQMVLGALIGTFLFCLLVLRSVRGVDERRFVPHLSVSVAIALAIVCVGALIYFIHHISQSIQAAHVIANVGREFDEVVHRLFPTEIGRGPNQEQTPAPPARQDAALVIEARGSGYVQSVDTDSLMKLACERGLLVELSFRPGDMVMPGDVLARVWPADAEADEDDIAKKINGCFVHGVQRTAVQDALFPIDQLAEIASRALSPGINDPFTAMSCLDRLGLALSKLAHRELPSGLRLDESGQPRVLTRALRFEDAAAHALDPIRHYGSDAPLVVNRLLLILERLAPHLKRHADRETLRRHAELTLEAARENIASRAEREGVEENYRKTAQALAGTSTC